MAHFPLDFDALNPSFSDLGAFIDEVDEIIEELETELLEGTFDDETDYADGDGIFGGDEDEVTDCELLLLDDDIID